jgi:galactokinase
LTATYNKELITQIEKQFVERFGTAPEHIARAPGRVNLLGEHVDYNDGFVMPAAIDLATYVAFSPSPKSASHLVALDFSEEIKFDYESVIIKTQSDRSPLPEWGLYPAGVMHALLQKGLPVPPINAVFASDLPRGSGLSSSASVEIVFLTTWQSLGGWSMSLMDRAQLCQKAETEYVGVNCGIMDQFSSACGVEDRVLYLDCRSLAWDTIALNDNVSIVIADTMVRRKLTTGSYNLRREECETAVSLLKNEIPAINSLRDLSILDYERYSPTLPILVEKRARHVIEEIQRTQEARVFLENGESVSFGKSMFASHSSLRDLYEVSCTELDTMVEIAQTLDGCLGARMTGAGFGGCTVNLVEREKTDTFISQLKEKYQRATGITPRIYLTKASNGAGIVR